MEDIETQTVRKLCWDGKLPGICAGTEAAASPCHEPATGSLEESQITSSLPFSSREGSAAPGGIWMLEATGGIKMKWEMHSTPTGTVDAG